MSSPESAITRHRVCRKCKVDKLIDQFTRDRAKRRGYKTICRECEAAAARARYSARKNGEVRAYNRRSAIPEMPKC